MQAEEKQQSSIHSKRLQPGVVAAGAWILIALLSLVPLTTWLNAALPLFTVVWLVVPLAVLLRTGRAESIGTAPVPWRTFAQVGSINFLLLALVMVLVEPWSHTYQALLTMVFTSTRPDLTFVWVERFPGAAGLVGMFLFSGAVTLFAEELFFRGWLLQALLARMRPAFAIGLQAFLFSIPQAIAALFLQPVQSILYVSIYSWLAIGVIGGWAAWRTSSIWPSLASAALMNLILTTLLR